MSQQLLAPTYLFHFSVPLQRCETAWNNTKGVQLDESCRLPSFGAELEGRPAFADVRAAWSDNGIFLNVHAVGKRQTPWCRYDRPEDSDGLHVWIDTRATHSVHRASRFCHRFVFLPLGEGRKLDEPFAAQMLINRARENPVPVGEHMLKTRSEKRVDGYVLQCHIPAAALTGFKPSDYPRLGFYYAVQDRELGWQTFSVNSDFPFDEDPSVWGTLELT